MRPGRNYRSSVAFKALPHSYSYLRRGITIDPRPYEIRLAQANAQLETANARLVLAGRELHRAEVLAAKAFGTEQTVDQRTADQRSGQAAVDDANAQIRDAEFDLEHC